MEQPPECSSCCMSKAKSKRYDLQMKPRAHDEMKRATEVKLTMSTFQKLCLSARTLCSANTLIPTRFFFQVISTMESNFPLLCLSQLSLLFHFTNLTNNTQFHFDQPHLVIVTKALVQELLQKRQKKKKKMAGETQNCPI